MTDITSVDHTPALPDWEAKQLEYYNPMLDPHCQAKMADKMRKAVEEGTYLTEHAGPLHDPDIAHPANLISSLHDDGFHRPALDIDIKMVVRPSKTEGHYHVEFPDTPMTWHDYCNLLDALAVAGIVEPNYVKASKLRGQTLLRTPIDRGVVDSAKEEAF